MKMSLLRNYKLICTKGNNLLSIVYNKSCRFREKYVVNQALRVVCIAEVLGSSRVKNGL